MLLERRCTDMYRAGWKRRSEVGMRKAECAKSTEKRTAEPMKSEPQNIEYPTLEFRRTIRK